MASPQAGSLFSPMLSPIRLRFCLRECTEHALLRYRDCELFLIPPTCGEGGHIVSGRERCDGWGAVFVRARVTPPGAPRHPPHEDRGRDKKEQPRSISNLQTAKRILTFVIASAAKQSMGPTHQTGNLDRFVAFAPRNDGLPFLSPQVGGMNTADAVVLYAMTSRSSQTHAVPVFTATHPRTPPRSRHVIRASFESSEAHLKFRGRRECRALDAPAASHAK